MQCKKTLLWLVSPDAILRLSQSKLANGASGQVKEFQNMYFDRPVHSGLLPLLEKLIENQSAEDLPIQFVQTFGLRAVVFTHSNIHADLHKNMQKLKKKSSSVQAGCIQV